MTVPDFSLRVARSIADIDAAAWDALAGSQPFLKHAFLHTLEASGCVSAQTGWQPMHLALYRGETLQAAMPLYLKSHSYGEYVFDWRWADAYERAGGRYFPKLLCAVPFTPVPGMRLLAATEADRIALARAAVSQAEASGLSSLHCLFPDTDASRALEAAGLMRRQGYQFHWPNPGYDNFDAFLATLTHDKRKKIRQERRKVFDTGVHFSHKTGPDITEADWAFFHHCYTSTYQLHGSTPYLNLEFFLQLGEVLGEQSLLIIGQRDRQAICSALNLFDDKRLYGRYWGATEFVSGLHFETCYYQGMAFCIDRGLQIFEGGAQGEHKLARGFNPVETVSYHWIADNAFGQVLADYLARETQAVARYVNELEGPYRAT